MRGLCRGCRRGARRMSAAIWWRFRCRVGDAGRRVSTRTTQMWVWSEARMRWARMRMRSPANCTWPRTMYEALRVEAMVRRSRSGRGSKRILALPMTRSSRGGPGGELFDDGIAEVVGEGVIVGIAGFVVEAGDGNDGGRIVFCADQVECAGDTDQECEDERDREERREQTVPGVLGWRRCRMRGLSRGRTGAMNW